MVQIPQNHFCFNNPLMRKSVDILDLPKRAANVLRNEGIFYIGQLMLFNKNNIMWLPNMGRHSAADVIEALARHDLQLGTVTPPIPSHLDFFTLDVEEFYRLDGEFSTLVSLPASAVAGLSDDDIVAAIQGRCQAAFNAAVVRKLNEAVAEFAAATSLTIDQVQVNEVASDKGGFPTFDIRKVEVPLKCEASLNIVFKKNALNAVAQSLSGTKLYPVLKATLDGLSSKPA